MIDAVLSYHMNPAACGVCKFNVQLAERLGVPCAPLGLGHLYQSPLTSIKTSELGEHWQTRIPKRGLLLLHDRPETVPLRQILYADEIGCPATIQGNATRGRYRVLTFGMAHKRILHHYVALKSFLDEKHGDYTLEMSTAIHEGTPWDEGLAESTRAMRAIFGDKLRVLGFLGDDAIAKELQDCDAVAVYFDPAFRPNNTSGWAVIEAGKVLYTNRDEHSPLIAPTWEGLVSALTGAAVETMTR